MALQLFLWIAATRPKTLMAAVVPVLVGTLLATPPKNVNWLTAGLALVGALLLQISCNFANELGDARRGADGPERLGPTRAVAAGLISGRAMGWATAVVLLLAFGVGLWLAALIGPVILLIGILSMIAALAYTMGPFPLAYRGLGELFVVLFFGLVATLGTAYVQLAPRLDELMPLLEPVGKLKSIFDRLVNAPPKTLTDRLAPLYHLIPLLTCAGAIGLQAAVLVSINNLRDRAGDERVNKRTLAVRWGDRGARLIILLELSLAAALWVVAATHDQQLVLTLFGLGVPGFAPAITSGVFAVGLGILAWRCHGQSLNRVLALSGLALTLTGITACVSLWR